MIVPFIPVDNNFTNTALPPNLNQGCKENFHWKGQLQAVDICQFCSLSTCIVAAKGTGETQDYTYRH